jgi:NADH:ubiquinone oxidoreductase subunit E
MTENFTGITAHERERLLRLLEKLQRTEGRTPEERLAYRAKADEIAGRLLGGIDIKA